ncbi:GtrA family protein [Azospirillum sp. sgz302134]
MAAEAIKALLSGRRALRFALVGVAATATYYIVTVGLSDGWTGVRLPASVANLIGFAVSLALSYVGHHRFTFGKTSRHDHYLPRFVAVSLTLAALSTGAVHLMTGLFGVPAAVSAGIVALCYPPASYALNTLWAFHR